MAIGHRRPGRGERGGRRDAPEPAAIDQAAKPDANGDLAAQPKAEVAPAAAAVPDPPRAEQGVADETAMKSEGKPDSPDEIEGDRARIQSTADPATETTPWPQPLELPVRARRTDARC